MYSVGLEKIVEKMKLENCTPEIDISGHKITQSEINRPALQLTGFFDYLEQDGVLLVEWSENIADALPENAIILEILSIDETTRENATPHCSNMEMNSFIFA